MLSRNICKTCINQWDAGIRNISYSKDKINFGWDDEDKKAWAKGVVACPTLGDEYVLKSVPLGWRINGNPPRRCAFHLEHLLDTQE